MKKVKITILKTMLNEDLAKEYGIGGHIESSHLRPSKIVDMVSATAEVTKVDGKKIEFKVSAYSGERLRVGDGTSGMTLLGEGTHLRFIVDKERFMSKIE